MALRGGRRLTANLRPPAGVPDGYIATVSGGFVVWVPPTDLGVGSSPVTVDNGAGGFEFVFDEDGNLVYA